jgi:hypothetical protein
MADLPLIGTQAPYCVHVARIIWAPQCDKIVIEFVGIYGINWKGCNCCNGFNGLILKVKGETRPEIKPLRKMPGTYC